MFDEPSSEISNHGVTQQTLAESELVLEAIQIEPLVASTTFGEQICYDGRFYRGSTAKGVAFDAHLSGRLRRNLSDNPDRSSSLKIDFFGTDESRVQMTLGSVKVNIFEPTPILLKAFKITTQPDQKVVMITSLLSSQVPRKGVGTKLFDVFSASLPTIVNQAVEVGVYPTNTLFIRVIIDEASLEGWAQWQTKRMRDAGENVIEAKAGSMYYQLISPAIPDSTKLFAWQEDAAKKKTNSN